MAEQMTEAQRKQVSDVFCGTISPSARREWERKTPVIEAGLENYTAKFDLKLNTEDWNKSKSQTNSSLCDQRRVFVSEIMFPSIGQRYAINEMRA